MKPIEAEYSDGVLKPSQRLDLRQGEHVSVIVLRHPDPARWDLNRLANTGEEEDLALADQGIDEWCEMLAEEDAR